MGFMVLGVVYAREEVGKYLCVLGELGCIGFCSVYRQVSLVRYQQCKLFLSFVRGLL